MRVSFPKPGEPAEEFHSQGNTLQATTVVREGRLLYHVQMVAPPVAGGWPGPSPSGDLQVYLDDQEALEAIEHFLEHGTLPRGGGYIYRGSGMLVRQTNPSSSPTNDLVKGLRF